MTKQEYTKLDAQPKTRVIVFEALFDVVCDFSTDIEEILDKIRETGSVEIVDDYFIVEDPDAAYNILLTRALH